MKFRKRPVVIEAMLLTADNASDVLVWMRDENSGRPCTTDARLVTIVSPHHRPMKCIAIETWEGTMTALVGDWIIRGIRGEFYPCKPEIFEETYEAVEA